MSGPAPAPRPRRRRRWSTEGRLALALSALLAIALGLQWFLLRWLDDPLLASAVSGIAVVLLALAAVRGWLSSVRSLFRTLAGAARGLRDGDFSSSIHYPRDDELGDLVAAYNDLAGALREERQNLFQRELMLDTVVQHTPVALVLLEPRGHVVYANIAARQLFNAGRRLDGKMFAECMADAPCALAEAVEGEGDRLCSFEREGEEETFHLARRRFRLNGREHSLLLFRRLTPELARQEVATWKKVIRVISHELNNSLAPITSMAHTGGELLRRGDTERLARVFEAIAERARHLDGFIRGYARFAKLPAPQPVDVEWKGFVDRLAAHHAFVLDGELPARPGRFDPAQLEQALINLLKNAHESGSPPEEVKLSVRRLADGVRIEVRDRGDGMSEAVLANALVPFYSTKRAGTGLGLALAREICEAHGGRIALANREGGGLKVSLVLPD